MRKLFFPARLIEDGLLWDAPKGKTICEQCESELIPVSNANTGTRGCYCTACDREREAYFQEQRALR